ncbi:glycosyltransferase [Spirochaeta africana]|uniref:Glycosyltransferase n=1 Tax=Spirochaeta africana (strain ATCC 700263 / DSM 8902 / Z-7692) TaxID=889378 RepID=H9UH64_SPIAZ|nr:glycosyltransferase [Spirochaeta africana]AFG36857.1 glycosyltransferase [Spirochaeta africana DSM 8902]
MRVLLVTCEDPGNPLGGMGVFIREFSQTLKTQCEVKVLLVETNQGQEVSPLVDYVVRPDVGISVTNSEAVLLSGAHSAYTKVMKALDGWCPDIIHCNDRQTYLPFLYCENVVFSLHLSLPDLFGFRNLDDRWFLEMKIEKAAAKHARAFCVYSSYYQNRVLDNLSQYASPVCLPLGIHPEHYYSQKSRNKKVISFFGRLVQYQKGADTFLDAVKRFSPEYLKEYAVEFKLFGKTKEPERFQHPNIDSIQFVDGAGKYAAYAETDIVVMPSTYEPFGLVGIEAIASGCLLLAPEGLGMDEYLQSGKNFLPIQSSADSIYSTLDSLIRDWDNVRQFQQTAQETVQHWTWKRSVQKHLEIYRAVLSGRINHYQAVNSSLARDVLTWREQELETRTSLEQVKKALNMSVGSVLLIGAEHNQGGQVAVYTGLAEHLPYADYSFDTVVALHEIEYGVDVQLALAEISRVAESSILLAITIGSAKIHQVFQFNSVSDVEEQLAPLSNSWEWSTDQQHDVVWVKLKRVACT